MARPVKRRHELRLGGIVYIAVAVFIGLAALNNQTNLLFGVFGLMLGGLLVSGTVSAMIMSGLSVHRLLPDHGVVGEQMVLRYELTNRRRWMPCFALVIREMDGVRDGPLAGPPHGWVLHIGPRSTVQADAIGWPAHRGPVMLNRVRISTNFPFGIIRRSIIVSQPGRLLVYPRLYRLRRDLLASAASRDPMGGRMSRQSGGSEEFYGLREYRYGDSMRRIDWKRSAHAGKLLSREMTRPSPPKLMVMLDLRNRDDEPDEEAETAISLAASVICEAHLQGYAVGLAVAGAEAPMLVPRRNWWHRGQLLHALAQLDLEPSPDQTEPPTLSQPVNWLVVQVGQPGAGSGASEGARHLYSRALASYLAAGEAPPVAAAGAPKDVEQDRASAMAATTSGGLS